VYGQDGEPCALCSVKTDLGDLEPVSGLIKPVLALGHGAIPASLHFTRFHPALGAENVVWQHEPVAALAAGLAEQLDGISRK
jgi:acyl transferase domain-containing protein